MVKWSARGRGDPNYPIQVPSKEDDCYCFYFLKNAYLCPLLRDGLYDAFDSTSSSLLLVVLYPWPVGDGPCKNRTINFLSYQYTSGMTSKNSQNSDHVQLLLAKLYNAIIISKTHLIKGRDESPHHGLNNPLVRLLLLVLLLPPRAQVTARIQTS